jgi:hypothetical protein
VRINLSLLRGLREGLDVSRGTIASTPQCNDPGPAGLGLVGHLGDRAAGHRRHAPRRRRDAMTRPRGAAVLILAAASWLFIVGAAAIVGVSVDAWLVL